VETFRFSIGAKYFGEKIKKRKGDYNNNRSLTCLVVVCDKESLKNVD